MRRAIASASVILVTALLVGVSVLLANADQRSDVCGAGDVTSLRAADFRHGTYIIDRPGIYHLSEDVSFNPNSPAILTAALAEGEIPAEVATQLGLSSPVDAYHAAMPLPTQFRSAEAEAFTAGGPIDARYDPAGYGIGFFAAIAITTDEVCLDLRGHTIEQSAEHALLQRFFAVIELADQPFVPAQGPSDFGGAIDSARRVTIANGTIGRSAHHGIHGNGNSDIEIRDVDFDGYEVGAVALNGVSGLEIDDATATNRKDVPVLGTFSSAQFIKAYIEHLARTGSATTLTVEGEQLDVGDVAASLQKAINATHSDIIGDPNIVGGRAQIDAAANPEEYELFHNPHGVVDGNSYSFLVNNLGVAVDAFPHVPDGVDKIPAENVSITDVRVVDQRAFVNEVIAIDVDGAAAIDPVGAVFQIRNLHPDTARPITISGSDDSSARYTGNVVANAQALVARADNAGEFDGSGLSVERLNIPANVLAWVQGEPGSTTLSEIGVSYLCNGDSMFHVNKGVIAFKMDGAVDVRLNRTSADGLENLGTAGSSRCGNYLDGRSHPKATLLGYGGGATRGYTFAGSQDVEVSQAGARDLIAANGSAIGFDVLTDSSDIALIEVAADELTAGSDAPSPVGPNAPARAIGFEIGSEAGAVSIASWCARNLDGPAGSAEIVDASGSALVAGVGCAQRRP